MQGKDLSDGFEEIFSFQHHMSDVKGMRVMEVTEENPYIKDRKDTYISWDIGGVVMWERPHAGHQTSPKVSRQIRFPKTSPGFITSLVYIKPLNLFVAAALDMSFKLYNRQFELMETIRHDERAILCMEYDEERRVIIMAGATGVTIWRIYRTTTANMEYVIERIYKFDGSIGGLWIPRISLDPNVKGDVYAFSDQSVYVIDIDKRKCRYNLENIHDAMVTSICWYQRSQFYMTGCVAGKIKCWTALHWKKHAVLKHGASSALSDKEAGAGAGESETLSLLHTFNVHTAAIAGILLHPVSGMGVSASMDGMIQVLNLEMFTVIYTINLHGVGIRSMSRINLAPAGKMGLLFEDVNHDIKLWKFASVAAFFGIASDDVVYLKKFEDMQLERLAKLKEDRDLVAQQRQRIVKADFFKRKHDEDAKKEADKENLHRRTHLALSTAAAFGDNAATFDLNLETVKDSRFVHDEETGDLEAQGRIADEEEEYGQVGGAGEAGPRRGSVFAEPKATGTGATIAASAAAAAASNPNAPHNSAVYITAQAGRDLRLFTERSRLVSCMDPEVLVDGIQCYTVSVHQQLLFCLFESGALKVYCIRSGSEPGEWSKELRVFSKWNAGVGGEQEKATCMTLVNRLPLAAVKPPISDTRRFAKDLRGQPVPEDVNELIAVGTQSGLVVFLDTMNDCKAAHVMQGRQGSSDSDSIEAIDYRYARCEIFTTGRSPNGKHFSIRVWHLPEISLVCEVLRLPLISEHPNAFAISQKMSYFGVGCTDGDVRIFSVMDVSLGKPRNGSVTAVGEGEGEHASEAEKDEEDDSSPSGVSEEKVSSASAPSSPSRRAHPGAGTKGQMEVVFRSGDLHDAPVTALDFCDAVRVYASASADQVVKLWTCEKQILRTIQYNMPTHCLCFNDGLHPGDCIFAQFSYLLNIKRAFWDDGDILQGIRDHVDVWIDKGLGAGFFQADDVPPVDQRKALKYSELTPRDEEGYALGPIEAATATVGNTATLRDTSAANNAASGKAAVMIGTRPSESSAEEPTAYFLRRENKSKEAVEARSKLAAERVQKVATPWRKPRRIGSDGSAKLRQLATANRTQLEHDQEEEEYWADPEVQRAFLPIDTSARPTRATVGATSMMGGVPLVAVKSNVGPTEQGLYSEPDPGMGMGMGGGHTEYVDFHRAPSPRSIHFGFEPADPADLNRGFAPTPQQGYSPRGAGGGGGNMPSLSLGSQYGEHVGESVSVRERMQRFNAQGLGARGSALLIAPSGGGSGGGGADDVCPSAPSGGGPSSSISTPNRRNRALRATSPVDTSSYVSEGAAGGDVAATSVPSRFREAKLREQKSLRSRESVLRISRRVLDVHSLDNDRFQMLENAVAKPAHSPRSVLDSEEYLELQQYNPGILPC